jgi:predicted nucleotidyltransferase
MSVTTVITEMVERIVREFQPEKIILFGSHARGDAHKWSDVDLLVVMPDGTVLRPALHEGQVLYENSAITMHEQVLAGPWRQPLGTHPRFVLQVTGQSSSYFDRPTA